MSQPQSYANHARIVPLFHYVVLPILTINLGWSIYDLFGGITGATVRGLAVAAALFLLSFFARVFALRAQDRVIRLEMQLRMKELLPSDLQPRIGEFTAAQLIALRFASDQELPALAARVLADRVQDRKAIKQMVTSWRADNLRV